MSEAIARELAAMRRRVEALETIERGRFAARVYNDAAISLATGVPQALTFNAEEFDSNGLHSTSTNTGRLTAPVGGIYVITGHVTFDSNATGRRQISIRKNGATALWYNAVAGGIAAYDPYLAADYATSKSNLLNPGTYDAGDGVGYPTHATGTGWTFAAASSQYLTTGITPAAFNQDYSMFVWYTVTNIPNQRPLLSAGTLATTPDRLLDIWASDFPPPGGRFYGSADASANVPTGTDAYGWMGISGREMWFNGENEGTLAALTNNTATGQDIRIGQYVPSGWYHDGTIKRVWISNTVIPDASVPVLYRAMTDLAYPAIAHQETTAIDGDETDLTVTAVEYLAAGEYVELLAYQNSGGALNALAAAECSPYFAMVMA